jgi:hypothetical protein
MPEPIFKDPKFDALRNAIYHTSRGRFLDAVNRFFNFLVIVLGAGAVAKVTDTYQLGPWVELGIVIVATIQLVFDFGGRACAHLALQKQYFALLAEMETSTDVDTDKGMKKWSAKLLTIAGDEPLAMRALDALAYNSALDALISDLDELERYRLYVPWWQRRLRHVVAFQGTQFRPRQTKERWWHRVFGRKANEQEAKESSV